MKWFNATKGFGFVTMEDGADAFCHASALASQGATALNQGDAQALPVDEVGDADACR